MFGAAGSSPINEPMRAPSIPMSFEISAVVLAKARTHNHRRSSLGHAGASIVVTTSSCGYGSRVALASARLPGTTKGVPAARFASGLCKNLVPPIKRGRECRALAAPAGLVCKKGERTQDNRQSRDIPAFPAQWLYGLLRALPGVRAFEPPSPRALDPRVDPSVGGSGPRGLTVRAGAFACRTESVHHDPRNAS